jgi:hypothetical protein
MIRQLAAMLALGLLAASPAAPVLAQQAAPAAAATAPMEIKGAKTVDADKVIALIDAQKTLVIIDNRRAEDCRA